MLEIKKCRKCNLCNNQSPLLDKSKKCDVMWVGLSAKKVDDVDKTIPLCSDTNSGKIIEMIEERLPKIVFVLGKNTYNFIHKYFVNNGLAVSKLVYIEHPPYIYVYKRKYIDEYVDKIVSICNNL